jgi:hypothetical protein
MHYAGSNGGSWTRHSYSAMNRSSLCLKSVPGRNAGIMNLYYGGSLQAVSCRCLTIIRRVCKSKGSNGRSALSYDRTLSNVQFGGCHFGATPGAHHEQYYQSADVYCLPSVFFRKMILQLHCHCHRTTDPLILRIQHHFLGSNWHSGLLNFTFVLF